LGYPRQAAYAPVVPKTRFSTLDDHFRSLLKELRTSAKLTQSELATAIGHPQSYVSKYELGERDLSFVETMQVCEALGSSIEAFAAAYAKRVSRGTKRS
jgi:transcriptional regulator with XRE-family HTH domain